MPRSEPTDLGDQFLIVDIPRRAIPATALRARAGQRDYADLPLFGSAPTDEQLAIKEDAMEPTVRWNIGCVDCPRLDGRGLTEERARIATLAHEVENNHVTWAEEA